MRRVKAAPARGKARITIWRTWEHGALSYQTLVASSSRTGVSQSGPARGVFLGPCVETSLAAVGFFEGHLPQVGDDGCNVIVRQNFGAETRHLTAFPGTDGFWITDVSRQN